VRAREERLARLKELEAKAAAGDQPAAAEALILEVELRRLDYAAARQRLAKVELADAQKRRLEPLLLDLEATTQLRRIPANPGDPSRDEMAFEAARYFRTMKKEGRIPTGPLGREFWSLLLTGAARERNAKLYAQTLGEARERLGEDQTTKALFERWQAELERLEKAR
jgi:hypothetical protein